MRVISKRRRGPLPQVIAELVHELIGQVDGPANRRENVRITGYPMSIYHDLAGAGDAFSADIEIAFPVAGPVTAGPGFEVKTIPEHDVVSVIHVGPYGGCESAHARAMGFIAGNGLSASGPFIEIYMNGPDEVPESGLMTEIRIPVVRLA